jgi:hypothetical protein
VPPIPPHPPIIAGPVLVRASPSQWSTPLGVVMIVFGVFGMLSGCMTLVSLMLQDRLMGVAATDPATASAMQASVDRYGALSAASGVFAAILAIALTAAGAGVAARRPVGVTVAKWWAVLKIVYAVLAVAVGFMAAQDQITTMTATAGGAGGPGGAGPGQAAGVAVATAVMGPFMLVIMLVQLLWLCALPVFVLVWFRRASIKAEVAQWGAGVGAGVRR